MLDGFIKYGDLVKVGLCIAFPAVFLYAYSKPEAEAGPVVRFIVTNTNFIQDAMTWMVEGVADRWETHAQNSRSLEDARKLRRDMAGLRRVAERVAELERENERLRALLNARPTPAAGRSTAARVKAVGASPIYRTVRIDVGWNDGVRRGMAVLNAEGAVGSVFRTAAGDADVLLITDRQSAVDVEIPRTGARGLLHGNGALVKPVLRVDGLDRSDDVRPGDEVVASGLGARFPRGVRIGTVQSVEQPESSIYQAAVVEPAARFQSLTDVLVMLTQEEPVLPPPSAPGPAPNPEGATGSSKDAGSEGLADLVQPPPAWVVMPMQDGGPPDKSPNPEQTKVQPPGPMPGAESPASTGAVPAPAVQGVGTDAGRADPETGNASGVAR